MSNIHIRIAEYIELLNNGYIPKSNDILTKFSDGSSINRFWTTNKDKIIYTLNNDLRYQIGYEQAKAAINKNTVRHKLQEFIELLNNGYIPTKLDYQTKFKNGESINFFWPNHKDKVINALNNDPNYQIGYEKAKEIISQLATKTSIEIKLSRRINEYIELLNHGYIPNSNENKVKFQNGDLINQFWQNQKERIITTLNNDPKYEVGYETAKDIINQLATKAPKEIKLSRQITEYIELINTGYIPKTQDNSISFSSGELINFFWRNHKGRVIATLNNDPKYQVGYEQAKEIIKKFEDKPRKMTAKKIKKENTRKIKLLNKIAEYIELLNTGYTPRHSDPITKFQDGKAINQFWFNHKDLIISILNSDLKYQTGYETAKETTTKLAKETPKQLEIKMKIYEYIELVNSGYIPKTYDNVTTFKNGSAINQFWINNKDKIIDKLNNDLKYQEGYDKVKKIINKLVNSPSNSDIYTQKISEYIELLNTGYTPLCDDTINEFKVGGFINHFWPTNKKRIIAILNSDPKYQVGYELAKETAKKYENRTPKEISLTERIEEYIDLVNVGYEPKIYDNTTKFKNGEVINKFWFNHKDQILSTLNSNLKYQVGYELAKETLSKLENQRPKETIIYEKVDEYINLLNHGYIPRYNDVRNRFSNGEAIGLFWKIHQDKIIATLNNNLKYVVGYEKAKKTITKLENKKLHKMTVLDKIKEYIELLNHGYIPKYKDEINHFSNGEAINSFWTCYKDRIIATLNSDLKYQIGYETAKENLTKIEKQKLEKLTILDKIKEYIDLLNTGYQPKYKDEINHFSNGEAINFFWMSYKTKIIDNLNNNLKYQEGYETAKKAIIIDKQMTKEINKQKENLTYTKVISKDQILKYLKIEDTNDDSIKSIIQNACFNEHVSMQSEQIKKAYCNTLDALDILDTLDENLIVDIMTCEIIKNHLEKEEREEFKKAVLSYLEKVKELQKLDVAFEENGQLKKLKIRKYKFDEYDIEECVLISLEFNQTKFIELATDLYNRRKLISSCIIDWNELTDLEKQTIINQNNLTVDEISLINEKQEEIKILKKMR